MLGLLGTAGTGLAIAPALRVLNYPFLALTLVVLGRGWYLQVTNRSPTRWRRRAGLTLAVSTITAVALWGLRFAGVLGMRPF